MDGIDENSPGSLRLGGRASSIVAGSLEGGRALPLDVGQ